MKPGFNEVVVRIGTDPWQGRNLMGNITGIRYAWGTNVSHDGSATEPRQSFTIMSHAEVSTPSIWHSPAALA